MLGIFDNSRTCLYCIETHVLTSYSSGPQQERKSAHPDRNLVLHEGEYNLRKLQKFH